jgi:hypothetical protein
VALCQARISTKPLWGFSSSNPYPTQSRAEQDLPENKWASNNRTQLLRNQKLVRNKYFWIAGHILSLDLNSL